MAPLSIYDAQHVHISSIPCTEAENDHLDGACPVPLTMMKGAAPLAQTPKKTKKSVSFNNKVRARKHLHIENFTKEEIEACWYSLEDSKKIRRDARFVGDMVDSGLLENDFGQYCRRGLESFITSSRHQRKQLRQVALDAVLDNQEDGTSQEEIALWYEDVSSAARARARSMGLKDELEAFQQ